MGVGIGTGSGIGLGGGVLMAGWGCWGRESRAFDRSGLIRLCMYK